MVDHGTLFFKSTKFNVELKRYNFRCLKNTFRENSAEICAFKRNPEEREKHLTYLRGCWVGSHIGIAIVELAWDGYIALVTRLHTMPGKKEHGGRNGEGRRKGPTLGNILR